MARVKKNVKIKMETGRMAVSGDPAPAPEKIRKFPDVPMELKEQIRELELEKNDLAEKRAALLPDYDPALQVRAKECYAERVSLYAKRIDIQGKANTAKKARERLKHVEAKDRAARRAGNAA